MYNLYQLYSLWYDLARDQTHDLLVSGQALHHQVTYVMITVLTELTNKQTATAPIFHFLSSLRLQN